MVTLSIGGTATIPQRETTPLQLIEGADTLPLPNQKQRGQWYDSKSADIDEELLMLSKIFMNHINVLAVKEETFRFEEVEAAIQLLVTSLDFVEDTT